MRNNNEIKKLSVDQQAQTHINEMLSTAATRLLALNSLTFDGKYKPEKDECLEIDNYSLPTEIKDAIDDPLKVIPFEDAKDDVDDIKAIFIGLSTNDNQNTDYIIAFQKLRSDQYISAKKYRLFLDKNSFKEATFTTLGISSQIDCLFMKGKLFFTSAYQAKQILDISKFYKEATDKDLEFFTTMNQFDFEDKDSFINNANQSIRKRVASIIDSGVFERYRPREISKIAEQTGLNITVKDDRIVFPKDNNDAKILLTFLDEGIFKGPFTDALFMTNSKRTLQ